MYYGVQNDTTIYLQQLFVLVLAVCENPFAHV